jgi:hypothetical protein
MLTIIERNRYENLSNKLPFGSDALALAEVFIEYHLWDIFDPIKDLIDQKLEDWNKD